MKKTLVDWLGKYTSWVTGDYELTNPYSGNLSNQVWLVVSTPLKNISQSGSLFPIDGKNVPNHQPEVVIVIIHITSASGALLSFSSGGCSKTISLPSAILNGAQFSVQFQLLVGN